MTDSTVMMDSSGETSGDSAQLAQSTDSAAPATTEAAPAAASGADVSAQQMAPAGGMPATQPETEEGLAAMSHIPGSLKDLKGGELEPAAGCPVQTAIPAPEPGEVITMEVQPGEVLQVTFELEQCTEGCAPGATDPGTMQLQDGNLVIDYNGGQVVLVGYEAAQPELLDVNCEPFIPELEPAAGLSESAGPLYRLVAAGALPETDIPFVPLSPPGSPPPGSPPESPPPSPPPPPGDDDVDYRLSISPADPQEGLPLAFQVTVDKLSVPVTITFETIAGTATPGVDIEAGNFRVLFPGATAWVPMGGPNGTTVVVPAGVTTFMVEIDTLQDNLLEGQERFTLTAHVNSPDVGHVRVTPGEGLIEDNENLSVDIADGVGTEGAAGGVVFTLTLLGPDGLPAAGGAGISSAVTIDLSATSGGATDTATPGSDYATGGFQYSVDGGTTWINAAGVDGTLVTIPAGVTSILVRVPTLNDGFAEGPESFTLTGSVVSSPGYHNVKVDAGNGIIIDDESGPAATPGVTGQGRETVLDASNLDLSGPAKQVFVDNGIQIQGPDNGSPTKVTVTMTNALAGDRLSFGDGFTINNLGELLKNGIDTGLTASIAAAAGGLIIVTLAGTADAAPFHTFDQALQSLQLTNLDGSLEAVGARGIDVVVNQGAIDSVHLDTTFKLSEPHFDLSMERGDITTPNYTDGAANSNIAGDANNNVIDGGGGNDFVSGGGGDDQLSGGAGENVLVGGAGNDVLTGGDDADKMFGGSGQDLLQGNGGADWLFGDSGADDLQGGLGDDVLTGGAGGDQMTGGGGADTFAYQNVHEVDSDGNGSVDVADVIHDFNAAEGDTIDVSGLLNNLGDPGNVHNTVQVVQDGANANVQVDLGQGAGMETIAVVEGGDAATVQTQLQTS